MAAPNKSYSKKNTYKYIISMGYTTKEAAAYLGYSYDNFVYLLRTDLKSLDWFKYNLPEKTKDQKLVKARHNHLRHVMRNKKLPFIVLIQHFEMTVKEFEKKLIDKSFYSRAMKAAKAFKHIAETKTEFIDFADSSDIFKGKDLSNKKFKGSNPIYDRFFFGNIATN